MKCLAQTLCILFFFPLISFCAVYVVPGDFPTIQKAIDSAEHGDEIIVLPGTYFENLHFYLEKVTVRSLDGPEVTVLDGNQNGSVVTFASGERPDTVIDGFTITNGSGTLVGSNHYGGGIHCNNRSSPTITNNIITGNNVDYGGGGISCDDHSDPLIVYNTISNNRAGYHGGGIFCDDGSSAEIQENMIMENEAGYGVPPDTIFQPDLYSGGGVFGFKSSLQIHDNIIKNNTGTYHGGGVLLGWNSVTTSRILNNVVFNNQAQKGAGIYCCHSSNAHVQRNQVYNNTALLYGGGICCRDEYDQLFIKDNDIYENSAEFGGGISCEHADTLIVNNFIFRNSAESGGGIHGQNSDVIIVNNTIFYNDAVRGGAFFGIRESSPRIVNTICWQNEALDGPELWIGDTGSPATLIVNYCDVEGGQASVYVAPGSTLMWGNGIIDSDPLFVDADGNDFNILYPSPCRDAGTNAVPEIPSLDPRGDPRIAYDCVDIGADEFYPHLYVTGHLTPGEYIDAKIVGVPGTAPVGLFIGSGESAIPLEHRWGLFYLEFPIILFVLWPVPTDGIIIIRTDVPTSPPAPYNVHMQALIGDQLSNLSIMKVR